MKKYLLITISFYIATVFLFLTPTKNFILKYPFLDKTIVIFSILLTLMGISFGIKSVNIKESEGWGKILIITGTLMLLPLLLLLMLARI